jgi:hypothetical protein
MLFLARWYLLLEIAYAALVSDSNQSNFAYAPVQLDDLFDEIISRCELGTDFNIGR